MPCDSRPARIASGNKLKIEDSSVATVLVFVICFPKNKEKKGLAA
jgi:hypothetical protein